MNERFQVLVVDDDATVLAAVALLLAPNCDLRLARNGRDALRLARMEVPELVLLDVEMPGLDGHEVCRQMKVDPLLQDVPVIFLTAHGDLDAEVAGLAAGAVDFIVKPPRGPVVEARIGTHVRMKRMADTLRAAALTDSLTGVANRRRFDDALAREWLRTRRAGTPLGLLMIDIDQFKAYNDCYGHAEGDRCLRAVAAALRTVVRRPADLLARYGGEEFVLLLPETDATGVQLLALQAVAAVAQAGMAHAAATHGLVTVSVGACAFDESCEAWTGGTADSHLMPVMPLTPPPPSDALARAADLALYAAKHAGRHGGYFLAFDLASNPALAVRIA